MKESKDVKDIRKQPQPTTADARTEVDRAQDALAEAMLFGQEAQKPPAQGPARIIVGIDATSSMGEYLKERRITADAATAMAQSLFAGRPGLQVQLAVFRGHGQSAQFRISKWYSDPSKLAQAITAIDHRPGWTQHCRLLRHAVAEAEQQPIQSLVIISDAFEAHTPLRPHGDDLEAARVHAERLRDLGVSVSVAYKGGIAGGCPLDRAGVRAEQAFRAIADANSGHCFLFRPADRAALAQRFGEIANQATLAAQGDAVGAQALLEHFRTMPFEMTVVGEQVSAKCAQSKSEEQ